MKVLLRILAVLIGVPAMLLPVVVVWSLLARGFTPGKLAGFAFIGVLSFVVARAAVWLWRARPFWEDGKRLAEVTLALTVLVLLPVAANLEKASNAERPLVHSGGVVILVALYGLFRMLAPLCIRGVRGDDRAAR